MRSPETSITVSGLPVPVPGSSVLVVMAAACLLPTAHIHHRH
jgi:hypothetical protein